MSEICYNGLGKFTAIERLKQGLTECNAALTFLQKIEEGIIIQASVDKISINKERENNQEKQYEIDSYKKNSRKWCSNHNTNSHNTDECRINHKRNFTFKHNDVKDDASVREKEGNTLIIHTTGVLPKTKNKIKNEINKIKTIKAKDSGTDFNSEETSNVKKYTMIPEKSISINTKIGNGDKRKHADNKTTIIVKPFKHKRSIKNVKEDNIENRLKIDKDYKIVTNKFLENSNYFYCNKNKNNDQKEYKSNTIRKLKKKISRKKIKFKIIKNYFKAKVKNKKFIRDITMKSEFRPPPTF